MTHAQNGTILKSSQRRARSLLFQPVTRPSGPCRTLLTTDCTRILAAMTPPHFQKKPPRRAPTKGSPGSFGFPVHEATLCLESSQIPDASICSIKSDLCITFASTFPLFSTSYQVLTLEEMKAVGCSEIIKPKTSFRNGCGMTAPSVRP